jgi:diketogulonate reductase-like aldo/keto reductase
VGGAAEQKGIEQMQRSMSLLKHKPIDLMQVHNLVDLDVHLKTLRRWKEEGKVRYVGITHYTPPLIRISSPSSSAKSSTSCSSTTR